MPRFVIERQYLVPMYEHILVEAPSFEAACRKALDDIEEPWGNDVKTDFESSRATTIERAVEVPEILAIDEVLSLAHLLYDAGLQPLSIPDEFVDEVEPVDGVGFV